MLSSRLHLLACALVLALATTVTADDLIVLGAPPAGQQGGEGPSADPQALANETGETIVTVVEETGFEVGQKAEETATQANEEAQAAQNTATRRLATLRATALHVLDQAQDAIDDVKADADRRLQEATAEPEEEPLAGPEPQYAPVAAAYDVVAFRDPLILLGATAATVAVLFWLAGSTGLAGAGQAAGTTAAKDLRRLLPFASPLFTRFERDTVLGHPKRESLYAEIMTEPGITLQDLCSRTGLSRTAVSHHLRLLEQQHLIVSKRMGRSRHFFENGGRYGRDQKEAYAVLHNDRSSDVHKFIQANPGAIQKDLCDALAIQASVAHWHVRRLVEASLIEAVRRGRTVSYFPTQAVGYA